MAKFLCGSQSAQGNGGVQPFPIEAGDYATSINVTNPNSSPVAFTKYAIADYISYNDDKADIGTNEHPYSRAKPVSEALNGASGMQIDCSDIERVLLGGESAAFVEGWITITVPGSSGGASTLGVTAVYTSYQLVQNPSSGATTATNGSTQVVPILPQVAQISPTPTATPTPSGPSATPTPTPPPPPSATPTPTPTPSAIATPTPSPTRG